MSLVRDIIDRVFFPDRDAHAIPVLDGGFSPNERLDHVDPLGDPFDAPDALALDDAGTLYVSAGRTVFACKGAGFAERTPLVRFDVEAGALAWSAATGLLVAVAGRGVCAVDPQGRIKGWLEAVAGDALRCVTAIAVAADGAVYVTDGSRHNTADRWLQDLMENRPPSGRLIRCDADLGNATVIFDGLNWPGGAALTQDERGVLVTEAWAHRLRRFDRAGGEPRMLIKNFTGYPSRIARGASGGYWIAFFALRTQLTEFVLREKEFRNRMMANVPPHLWIGPSLGGSFDYREPNQIGRIKKLGIQKPWAPPRSYGLVARLDDEGNVLESFHSRTSGRFHGVTAVISDRDRVLVASKGHGRLAALSPNAAA